MVHFYGLVDALFTYKEFNCDHLHNIILDYKKDCPNSNVVNLFVHIFQNNEYEPNQKGHFLCSERKFSNIKINTTECSGCTKLCNVACCQVITIMLFLPKKNQIDYWNKYYCTDQKIFLTQKIIKESIDVRCLDSDLGYEIQDKNDVNYHKTISTSPGK